MHQLHIMAGTWNVNETRPSSASIKTWLRGCSAADVLCIGLQVSVGGALRCSE